MRVALIIAGLCLGACSRSAEAPDLIAVETRMVRDSATGATLPRLVLSARPGVEVRINAALDSLSASLACEDGMPFETRASVAYAADDVLSVSLYASYFCDTAYPTDDANLSETFDLTTGRRVPFEALWRDYESNRSVIAGVLAATLAPYAIARDEACADVVSAEALTQATFDYVLTPDGVLVQPELAHSVAVCAAEALVPYASVAAFAAEGGVLDRVAGASATQ